MLSDVTNKSVFLNYLQNKALFILILPFPKCQKINLVLPLAQAQGVPTNPTKPPPNDRTLPTICTVLWIFFLSNYVFLAFQPFLLTVYFIFRQEQITF